MKGVVFVEAKGRQNVKSGRINHLCCAEDQRINLENYGWKFDDHKDDAAKTKREVEVENGRRQWQADRSVH